MQMKKRTWFHMENLQYYIDWYLTFCAKEGE